jgi:hypothetical protein
VGICGGYLCAHIIGIARPILNARHLVAMGTYP